MRELISVIVPIYNAEKYINRCVDSILNQSFENIELILIDDGSSDLSGVICDNYEKKDSKVKVYHQENIGQSAARNKGIEISNGEYLVFVDADDYVSEDYIEYLYKLIKQEESDISVCGFEYFYREKANIHKSEVYEENIIADSEKTLYLMNTSPGEKFVVVWGKMYKKNLFDEIKFPGMKISEDYVVLYQLYNKAKKIVISDRKLYYYFRNNGESLTYNLKEDFYINTFSVLDKAAEYIRENGYPEVVPYVKKSQMYWIIEYYKIYSKDISKEQKKSIIKKYRKLYKETRKIKHSKMYKFFCFSPKIYKKIKMIGEHK